LLTEVSKDVISTQAILKINLNNIYFYGNYICFELYLQWISYMLREGGGLFIFILNDTKPHKKRSIFLP